MIRCEEPPHSADRVAGVDEVEEWGRDQVVEVGGVDGGAEGRAGGDRVVGAVGAFFAQVDRRGWRGRCRRSRS